MPRLLAKIAHQCWTTDKEDGWDMYNYLIGGKALVVISSPDAGNNVVDGLGDMPSNSLVLVGGGAQSVELTPHAGPGNIGAFTSVELSATVEDTEL